MPDFIDSHPQDLPRTWGEAFAALPPEPLPGDGWQRLGARLDARASRQGAARRERRLSWLIGIASAAVLAMAAWSPLSRWWQREPRAVQSSVVAATAPATRDPVVARDVTPPAASATTSVSKPVATASATHPADHEPIARAPEHSTARRASKRMQNATVATRTPASESRRESQPGITQAALAASTTDPLEKLKTQSAQLEALVAMARDDRVGSASSELLSGEIDAGIAAIDVALSRADLTQARQQELWQRRVDLLQQLAGVEATSRWLAAQGASNETLLVAVD